MSQMVMEHPADEHTAVEVRIIVFQSLQFDDVVAPHMLSQSVALPEATIDYVVSATLRRFGTTYDGWDLDIDRGAVYVYSEVVFGQGDAAFALEQALLNAPVL